jgi:hypothetical protein
MPRPIKYWLKPIHARPGERVAENWVAGHPWLLEVVGSSTPMPNIRSGHFVLYYAAGHQKLVAVAPRGMESDRGRGHPHPSRGDRS